MTAALRAIPGQAYGVDPGSDLDYSVAWASWLESGDTISVSTWEVSPAGPTLYGGSINGSPVVIDGVTYAAGTVTTIWGKGWVAGMRYTITNKITTTPGARKDERSFYLLGEQQ